MLSMQHFILDEPRTILLSGTVTSRVHFWLTDESILDPLHCAGTAADPYYLSFTPDQERRWQAFASTPRHSLARVFMDEGNIVGHTPSC